MSKNLVIVESPAKAATIEKYLGKEKYMVKATMGHLRDLPKSQFGIDVDSDFEPKYITVRGKTSLVKELHKFASQASKIYLATDPDREGEAIAWHLATLLSIGPEESCRIEFNEITKNAVKEAIKHARRIDADRVNAQQTRRILDRIVGYKLSPLLWKKVRRGLSAGRVQSVAVRLICDREREIEAFVVQEYWSIHAILQKKGFSVEFEAELITAKGEKIEIQDKTSAEAIQSALTQAVFFVTEVKRRDRQRKPYPPFITSTLQQDASHKLGFSAKKTMMLAQQLYEAGRITYMRTDSTRVSSLAQAEAIEWVKEHLGADYLPPAVPQYSKKSAQDAHEAIRPSEVRLTVDQLPENLNRDQLRLYELIWKRFVASQMKPAVFDTITVDISAGEYGLRASGSTLRFSGFMAVYADSADQALKQENERTLPPLEKGEMLKAGSIKPVQHFTEPPPRFTEAALIKLLEEKGIGRPSTYAPIIDTIQGRGYVVKADKKFQPTPLGFIVTDLLKEYFPQIVDTGFTAEMEFQLDEIAGGEINWRELLREFYGPFIERIAKVEKEAERVKVPEEITDIPCENCGAPMAVKHGRFGSFLGCTRFPECRTTKPIVKDAGVPCPLCEKPVIERKTKSGRLFYGCSDYPSCKFISWNKPVNQNCAVCGSFMVEKKYKNKPVVIECGNAECPSRAGTPKEELEKKLENQPKPSKTTARKMAVKSTEKAGSERSTKTKSIPKAKTAAAKRSRKPKNGSEKK